MLSAATALGAIPVASAKTEDSTSSYPYTMFASSYDDGAITVSAGNFCVNSNIATNGTIVSRRNINVNGTLVDDAGESMIYIFDKIDNQYFNASNVDIHNENYTLDKLNINMPTEVQGEATLSGNIHINNALKSLEDISLYGKVKSTNSSVIFSKYGDVIIDSQNANLNGLICAPLGKVIINAQNNTNLYDYSIP